MHFSLGEMHLILILIFCCLIFSNWFPKDLEPCVDILFHLTVFLLSFIFGEPSHLDMRLEAILMWIAIGP
jgi:hypothetical protein